MFEKKSPKQRALIIGLILLGVLFILFFGIRAFHAYKKFGGHRPPPLGKVETDVELIRDWMTISFVSEMYRVPEKVIFDGLNISPMGNDNKSLAALNHKYYPNANGFVLDTVKAIIRAHIPPPTAPAPAAP